MSPQFLPPGSRAGGAAIAAAWRRSRLKWSAIGAVVLLAAVVVVVTSGQGKQEAKGDGDPKLLRAPVQPMPAPASQVPHATASSVPVGCEELETRLKQVVQELDHKYPCAWGSDDNSTDLTVRVGPYPTFPDPFDDFTRAVGGLRPGWDRSARLKMVAHLGDEAYATYSSGDKYDRGEVVAGAKIVLRAGEGMAEIEYERSQPGGKAPGESQLMPPALRVAREVAKSLGAAGTQEPSVSNIPDDPPPVHARTAACAAVSNQTLQRLLGKHAPPKKDLINYAILLSVGSQDGAKKRDICTWQGRSRTLTIETLTLVAPAEGTDAQAPRRLEWLAWRARHRDLFPTGHPVPVQVLALTGHGKGAFATYGRPTKTNYGDLFFGEARVAFRNRNALIHVTYTGSDSPNLPQDQAINSAYTAATEAAATFTP